MPSGTDRTASAVTVTIARDPALVRTVRLVAASVARRAGRDEEFVEEVRLAAGEACALFLGEGRANGTTGGDPVAATNRLAETSAQSTSSMRSPRISAMTKSSVWACEIVCLPDNRISPRRQINANAARMPIL